MSKNIPTGPQTWRVEPCPNWAFHGQVADTTEISLCPNCNCATKTIYKRGAGVTVDPRDLNRGVTYWQECGKCGAPKPDTTVIGIYMGTDDTAFRQVQAKPDALEQDVGKHLFGCGRLTEAYNMGLKGEHEKLGKLIDDQEQGIARLIEAHHKDVERFPELIKQTCTYATTGDTLEGKPIKHPFYIVHPEQLEQIRTRINGERRKHEANE